MPRQDLTDEEIRADIMNRLLRKDCWGGKYLPLATLVNWLAGKVKKDGKRVRGLVKNLVGNGYLLLHKRGNTVSLNPVLSKEIITYVKNVIDGR